MATKQKKIWYCSECGDKQFKWAGQCSQCKNWNTYQEELEVTQKTTRYSTAARPVPSKPVRLKDVATQETPRTPTHVREFDRIMGGGIVSGSLTLIGGDPGIGKSTLLLQIANVLAKQGLTVLYVCGEESVEQTSMRAKRLGIESESLLLLSETHFGLIKGHIEQVQPQVLIIDSIQIVYKEEIPSSPGSVTQVRETTTELMHLAKGQQISIFIVGHVTKTGEIAGPRVLEHLVDTVLYFEGDGQHNFRMIRAVKNRFGPTDEIAVFKMQTNGLCEVRNPSEIFLEERMKEVAGSVIIPTVEGSRPILVEVQALVTKTVFNTPSRRCTGLDQNRLALLLAVLEKKMGYPLFQCDVFVSIAGGLRSFEPAIDLGILLAVASSMRNQPIQSETVVIGEVGLAGEIRSVPRIETRIKEALTMGFNRCIVPRRNIQGIAKDIREKADLIGVERVEEAISAAIG